MAQSLVQKTAAYVKAKLMNDHVGHDWYHVERVWHMARHLQQEEGGDTEIIQLTALLHDLGDYKRYDFSEEKGSYALHGIMDILGIEGELKEKILQVIRDIQYHAGETQSPTTVEGKILRDAVWLESTGALGIARTFAAGGHIKRVIHDPKRKPRHYLTKRQHQLRKREGTSINYFYEKVLKLADMMNTRTGKRIARAREQFVNDFIEEFLAEWEGER